MSLKRAILAGKLLSRESGHSALAVNGMHIRQNHGSTLLPAEHLGEVWVERNGVQQRRPADRELIFHEYNCAWLSANQNLRFTKNLKHQARLYLLDIYGREAIDKWLKEILDWPQMTENLL